MHEPLLRRINRWLVMAMAAILIARAASWPARAAMPKVPDGFKIRLVAAVPAVQYPCQVATAPDGSLFVGEDPMDQVGPANKPIDRILLFRDGKEPVVFADKLNAIFGMVWHDGALYVMNMPRLTVFRDRDGDGKADDRKELFTDLGVPAGSPNDFNDHIVSGLKIRPRRISLYLGRRQGRAQGHRPRRAHGAGGRRRHAPLPARRHRAGGLFHRHPQPPRAQPRRPRQPLHLRQHRRRPGLVDAGHPSHRRRLLRLSLRLPQADRPDAPPDRRVRRRLALRRRVLRRGRLAREVSGPALLGRVGQARRPVLPVRPRRRDVQGRRQDRLRRAGRRRELPPARPGVVPRWPHPLRRRLVDGRLEQQDREAGPGLRRDV